MEYSCTRQAQALEAECGSVKETADCKPSEGVGSGEQEAPVHGLAGYGMINLGGEDDNRRALDPVVSASMANAVNPGQPNPTGGAAVNGVDSVMMISLDDILDDLQKKVTSVGGNNVYEVKDHPADPAEGNSGKSAAQDVGTEVTEGTNNERKGETVNSEGVNEQCKDEVAGSQGTEDQCKGEGAGLQGTNEQHKGEGAAGSQGANEQHLCNVALSQGAMEQHKDEAAGLQGMNEQSKSEAANSLEQVEKAVVQAVGGGMEAVCHTPVATDKTKVKPYRHIEVIESPDWLPKGWSTELKTRGAGSSAGTKDKYYYDPVSKRRFRSRTEVFNFLETGKVGRYKSKIKSEGEVGRKRKNSAAVLSQNAASLDHGKRPTKVRWVLNDSEGSWIPFVSEEELNEFNRKEGEHFFDLNRNSSDACDHGQGKTMVLEDPSPSTRLTNDIMEVGIDSSAPKTSENVLPFVDSWSDPCLEFAVKTLTGAFPALEENLALQDALQNYFLPQPNEVQNLWSELGKSNPLGSDALPDVLGCCHRAEHPSLAEEQFPSTENLYGSKTLHNILSVSDNFPEKTLNRYAHSWREKKFMRPQAKDLLEPLGRKLCKRALDFLKGHKHSSLYRENQAKNISVSFHLSQNFHIEYGHQEQNIFASSFA